MKNSCLLIILLFLVSCSIQKPKNEYKKIILSSDDVFKSGTIIYDYQKVKAYFINKKLTDNTIKKSEIRKLISNPASIILLDQSILLYTKLDSFNLSSCSNDKSLIIRKKELVYNRFQLIPVKNEQFYKVERKYDDFIERIVLCKVNSE